MGLAYNGTGKQWACNTIGLGHNGLTPLARMLPLEKEEDTLVPTARVAFRSSSASSLMAVPCKMCVPMSAVVMVVGSVTRTAAWVDTLTRLGVELAALLSLVIINLWAPHMTLQPPPQTNYKGQSLMFSKP